MSINQEKRMIVHKLEQVWSESHAWPGYIQAMRAILAGFTPKSQKGIQLLEKWASLPGLCCQAFGGQAEWAEDLAAAWLAFYGAAYIMDSIEDGDKPGTDWAWLSPGMTVNAASGLYFSASIILSSIKRDPLQELVVNELLADFYRGFLVMCGGQHRDLSTDYPTLDEYWEIAFNKSGVFFAIACKSGARLATQDSEKINYIYNFGLQLGVLIQILDDIDDIQKAPTSERRRELFRTLPVIYALSNAKPDVRLRLENLLKTGKTDRESGEEILDIIDGTGAVRFLINEFERQRQKAISVLHQAEPLQMYEEQLVTFLPSIHK